MRFKHYGIEVSHQLIGRKFEDCLKEKGIRYIELPLLEDKVLRYEYEGKRRYAYIVPANGREEYLEHVYITTEIPEDLSWSNIELDYRIQKEKESSMLLPSRARVLYDAAKELVRKEQKPTSLMEMIAPVDKKELKLALSNAYGVSWEELKEMDHYDLDDSELGQYPMTEVTDLKLKDFRPRALAILQTQ